MMCQMRRTNGFSLIELLIGLAVSILIVGAIMLIYLQANKSFKVQKNISQKKEDIKINIIALDWFLQRWGVGVACINQNDPSACAKVLVDKNILENNITYPPKSALYAVINPTDNCDELIFFGSMGGMGFITALRGVSTVAAVSCRLNQNNRQNCYHIWRGARVFVDEENQNNKPLIFSIQNLSKSNIDCITSSDENVTLDITATAKNGKLKIYQGSSQIFTDKLTLEGGDLLIRVPHRIRLYCNQNERDDNKLWLYAAVTDMAENCRKEEPPRPLFRVDSFKVTDTDNGLLIKISVNENNGSYTVERFYGR